MSTSWDALRDRLSALDQQLAQESLDQKQRAQLRKEHSQICTLLEKHDKIEQLEKDKADIERQLAENADPEMRELFQSELAAFEPQLVQARQDLEDFLVPHDELDNRSVFLEVRAGTGGQEAALFAADLVKMYTLYGERKNWTVSVADLSLTDLGGVREVTLHIEGKDVYKHLKHESGVHRVQRVPKTETAGRVHTSTATVAVLPEAEDVDVSINPSDLRIDTYRASGAGGQHVNKTDSAIRITHIPTGVVVACQEERSQHKNRAKAMKMLQSRLLAAQQERQQSEESKQRKEQIGGGMRAEKVRTYNYPQNRITDHQVDVTLKNLDIVMMGDLDDIIIPLMQKEREERKTQALKIG